MTKDKLMQMLMINLRTNETTAKAYVGVLFYFVTPWATKKPSETKRARNISVLLSGPKYARLPGAIGWEGIISRN